MYGFSQSIEHHIRYDGTDYPPLRNSLACRILDAVFHVSSPQPLVKNELIHRDVIQHPLERDVVETAFYVSFEYP
jgi:hypothetical protein